MTGQPMKQGLEPSADAARSRRAVPLVAALLFSAFAWLLLFWCVHPSDQDFPLIDDFAYARSAFQFTRGEGIDYLCWAAMPQLGQWIWSVPFVWALGENFIALRLSTIALGWLGLAAFYDLLRGAGMEAPRAGLAAAALAFNPLFFLLQGTFMTDVPTLAFSLLALALYRRAFTGGGSMWMAAATLAAILGVVTRQNAVAAPAAAALLVCRSPGPRRLLRAFAILIPLAVAVLVHLWFESRDDVLPADPQIPPPVTMLLVPFLALHFGGLAALPLLALDPRPRSVGRLLGAIGIMALAGVYWAVPHPPRPGAIFPYVDGIVTVWGSFSGWLPGDRPVLLGSGLRLTLTILGCLAGGALLERLGRLKGDWGGKLLLVFGLVQLPLLLIVPTLYDRYFLFLSPTLLGAASVPRAGADRRPGTLGWFAATVALAAFAAVSVGLMHDWLTWNAARWHLGRRALAERHLEPTDVEGGLEWDGWFARRPPPRRKGGLVAPNAPNFFPDGTRRYFLAFSVPANAVPVAAEVYSKWLPPRAERFFLVRYDPKRR
jgi:hypothetical protein